MLRLTFRSLFARKLRLLLSALAVVFGITFVSGAFTLTDTLGKVFDNLFASVNDKTDVAVRGTATLGGEGSRRPVPEDLVATVQAVPGVTAVVPDVMGTAIVLGKDGKPVLPNNGPPSLGGNYDANPVSSSYTLRAGEAPQGLDQVALDAGTAKTAGYAPGDQVKIVLDSGVRPFTLSGVFSFGDNDNIAGASLAAFGEKAAQELLGRPGQLDDLQVVGDGTQSELRDAVAKVLPPGTEAITGQAQAAESSADLKQALGFVSTFLLVFAGVALFVGAFLIFNTFTILVAQRTKELALLRSLGASRRQITQSVLLESVIVGVVASAVGFGLGLLAAIGLRALIGSFGAGLPDGPLVILPRTVIACFVVGVGITALAALLPARRASAVAPVEAMREAATPEAGLRRTTILGLLTFVPGLVLVGIGLTGNFPLLGLGAVLTFLGVAALSPLLARPVVRVLAAPMARKVPGRLGRLNAMRNPRRTASTAAALMIGLALVSAVSVLGASAKTSVVSIVKNGLDADLIISSPTGQTGVPPEISEQLAALPQVGSVDALRFGQATVGTDTSFVTTLTSGGLGRSLAPVKRSGDVSELGPTTFIMDDTTATEQGLSVGQDVPVTFERGAATTLRLAGTYTRNALLGAYVFDASFDARLATQQDDIVLLDGAKGVAAGDLRSAVDGVTAALPTVAVQTPDELTAQAASQVDTATSIINVLLALSVLIAVLGIVNTLALAVFERTREIGLLRAIGLGRRATRSMIRVEAVAVAVFGALLGIVVGTGFGIAAQRALVDQGITELSFPYARIVIFVILAAVAGVVAAALPARRAARLDVLQAISAT